MDLLRDQLEMAFDEVVTRLSRVEQRLSSSVLRELEERSAETLSLLHRLVATVDHAVELAEEPIDWPPTGGNDVSAEIEENRLRVESRLESLHTQISNLRDVPPTVDVSARRTSPTRGAPQRRRHRHRAAGGGQLVRPRAPAGEEHQRAAVHPGVDQGAAAPALRVSGDGRDGVDGPGGITRRANRAALAFALGRDDPPGALVGRRAGGEPARPDSSGDGGHAGTPRQLEAIVAITARSTIGHRLGAVGLGVGLGLLAFGLVSVGVDDPTTTTDDTATEATTTEDTDRGGSGTDTQDSSAPTVAGITVTPDQRGPVGRHRRRLADHHRRGTGHRRWRRPAAEQPPAGDRRTATPPAQAQSEILPTPMTSASGHGAGAEPLDRAAQPVLELDRLDQGEQRPQVRLVGLAVADVAGRGARRASARWGGRGSPRARPSSSSSDERPPKARFTGRSLATPGRDGRR